MSTMLRHLRGVPTCTPFCDDSAVEHERCTSYVGTAYAADRSAGVLSVTIESDGPEQPIDIVLTIGVPDDRPRRVVLGHAQADRLGELLTDTAQDVLLRTVSAEKRRR